MGKSWNSKPPGMRCFPSPFPVQHAWCLGPWASLSGRALASPTQALGASALRSLLGPSSIFHFPYNGLQLLSSIPDQALCGEENRAKAQPKPWGCWCCWKGDGGYCSEPVSTLWCQRKVSADPARSAQFQTTGWKSTGAAAPKCRSNEITSLQNQYGSLNTSPHPHAWRMRSLPRTGEPTSNP